MHRSKLVPALLILVCFFSTSILRAQEDTSGRKTLRMADTKIENIRQINSPQSDATPTVSPDEATLYFTSYRDGKAVIYISKRSKDGWGSPQKFIELPEKENISAISLTGDGQQAVLQCCNRPDGIFHTCDIYQAGIEDGKLANIRSLGKNVNSEWWDGQPCISQDGQLLFFASDRKHGKGGIDIYMCSKNENGTWSDPVDLDFNTSGNELSPYIASDNQTLYFAADDLPGGMGGYDIYVTHRMGQNQWSAPKNLGQAVNSSKDELFFAIPPAEDAIYLSSNREGGVGEYDLYRISPNPVQPTPKVITLHGRVINAETGEVVATQPDIELSLSTTAETLTNIGSGAEYSASVPLGKLVKIRAGADGYVTSSIEVQAPSTLNPNGFMQDIKLAPSHARIDGHVTNVFTHKPLAAHLVLKETVSGQTQIVSTAESDPTTGAYTLNVNPQHTYEISTSVKDYETYASKVEVPLGRDAIVKIEKEIRLQPSQIDAVMVNFDFNKSDLKKEETGKMEKFIQQVKENPYVRIEVNGHTDDVGSAEYNEKLSERRAVSVEDYLLSRGVPRDQLAVVKGFGKLQPIDPGTSEEARAKNRRVEVRIVGKQQ